MKNLFILFLVFTVGCGNINQKYDKIEPEQVKQLIVEFLYAGNQSDFAELKRLTTSDFLIYSNDGEMNFNELVEFIQDWPEPDKFNFNEFDFEIETDCNSAFVNYHYGPTDINSENTQIDLHSAYIKRVGNELKINFLHSNTMEK
ncbi:MAG: hypothetical protein HKO92_11685 [Flavobacteriaceae bacterium]|nr:hypothetical protein [Flavobacteriaceae bacterium]